MIRDKILLFCNVGAACKYMYKHFCECLFTYSTANTCNHDCSLRVTCFQKFICMYLHVQNKVIIHHNNTMFFNSNIISEHFQFHKPFCIAKYVISCYISSYVGYIAMYICRLYIHKHTLPIKSIFCD